jgi:hypothetical protein
MRRGVILSWRQKIICQARQPVERFDELLFFAQLHYTTLQCIEGLCMTRIGEDVLRTTCTCEPAH